MLSIELRPKTWDEVAGQSDAKRILKAIVRNPNHAPRCLVFSGEFGCGKTTCARIFAREINKIKDVDYDLSASPFYYEYDSTSIGNVEEIKRLRDTFVLPIGEYWKIIVFDEAHSVSNAAQTALLKILEEVTEKTIFIFCTTHPQKLLSTILSRSLEIAFTVVRKCDIVDNIQRVVSAKNIDISEDAVNTIAYCSGGHVRNAHVLLDKYLILGEEDFRDSVKSAIILFVKFLLASYVGNTQEISNAMQSLIDLPMDVLRRDYETVFVEALKVYSKVGSDIKAVNTLVTTFGTDFNRLVQQFLAPYTQTMFTDIQYFQATMLYMSSQISQFRASAPKS